MARRRPRKKWKKFTGSSVDLGGVRFSTSFGSNDDYSIPPYEVRTPKVTKQFYDYNKAKKFALSELRKLGGGRLTGDLGKHIPAVSKKPSAKERAQHSQYYAWFFDELLGKGGKYGIRFGKDGSSKSPLKRFRTRTAAMSAAKRYLKSKGGGRIMSNLGKDIIVTSGR